MTIYQTIHQDALKCARSFKRNEHELLCVIQRVDAKKVYRHFGFKSLFEYCTKYLLLCESTTYTLIRVARKSVEIPEIKKAIEDGTLLLSHAKSIASVITPETKTQWIEIAKKHSVRDIEKEVAKVSPHQVIREKLRPISENQFRLECEIDTEVYQMIQRAKDLLAQKGSREIGINDVLRKTLADYLKRNDPLEKVRKPTKTNPPTDLLVTGTVNSKTPPSAKRVLPRRIQEQVLLRDKGLCQAKDPFGHPCYSARYLDVHHIVRVSKGGSDELSNLITYCKGHHQLAHGH